MQPLLSMELIFGYARPRRQKVVTGKSKNAKKASLFCLLAVVYGILMPAIPSSILMGGLGGAINGLVVVSIEAILVIVAGIFSYKAVFKEKDRSIITTVVFGLFCLVAGFWLLFALREILVPH